MKFFLFMRFFSGIIDNWCICLYVLWVFVVVFGVVFKVGVVFICLRGFGWVVVCECFLEVIVFVGFWFVFDNKLDFFDWVCNYVIVW